MGCLRGGLGVIVGYGAMSVFMFIVLSGIYLGLGTDGAFLEASY